MQAFFALLAVFGAGLGGLAALDREGLLPASYVGEAAQAGDRPPPRWYAIAQPVATTSRDGASVQVAVALQLPKRLPEFTEGADGSRRLAQEPVVRAIVTDTIMRRPASSVATAEGRRRLERLLRRRIRAHTDIRVRRVIIPDAIARP